MTTTAAVKKSRRAETLLAPTKLPNNSLFEYSIHSVPASFKRDLAPVFPDAKITSQSPILVIPTFQKATVNLTVFGKEQESEKDRLLLVFYKWSDRVRAALSKRDAQAWVDVTDPVTGMARWGSGASTYSDVHGAVKCLKYATTDCGGCTILKHPQWKYAVYPATLFTNAPLATIQEAIEEVGRL